MLTDEEMLKEATELLAKARADHGGHLTRCACITEGVAAWGRKMYEQGDKAGWSRAMQRIVVWLRHKGQALIDAGGDIDEVGTAVVRQHFSDAKFIEGREYEPPTEVRDGE